MRPLRYPPPHRAELPRKNRNIFTWHGIEVKVLQQHRKCGQEILKRVALARGSATRNTS